MASAATDARKKHQSKLKPKNTKTKKHQKLSKSRIKHKGNKGKSVNNDNNAKGAKTVKNVAVEWATSSEQQLAYFIKQYESSNGLQLSSLELDSLKAESCIVKPQDSNINLDQHMKFAFGSSWREVLCEKHLGEGQIDTGSPALLVISTSALRSLELLRELRSLSKECHAAKLFSKHMKIEEQVSILKNRVNIASGTPNRIKKLIDIEALGLSRLKVIVLDMHRDVKGYSLFTLPQVREEFWDLYRSYFHQRLLKGDIRLCFYGSVPAN